jgi:putative copper export protein
MNESLSIWTRAVLYVGAVVAVGQGLTALRASAGDLSSLRRRGVLQLLALLGALALLVAPIMLARQQLLALEMPWSELTMLVRDTGWGRGFAVLTLTACTTAFALCLPLSRAVAYGLLMSASALAVAMGGLGHAAADAHWPVTARVLDAVHVWTVGAWMGGLLFTWLATRPMHASGERSEGSWQQFSRVATVMAPLAVMSGMLSGARLLNGQAPRVILGSEYGQMLLVKSGLVLVMLVIGARQRSRIARGELPARRSVAVELGLAAWVLVVTATLTGTEPPGE